jgi:hypothetical protein
MHETTVRRQLEAEENARRRQEHEAASDIYRGGRPTLGTPDDRLREEIARLERQEGELLSNLAAAEERHAQASRLATVRTKRPPAPSLHDWSRYFSLVLRSCFSAVLLGESAVHGDFSLI